MGGYAIQVARLAGAGAVLAADVDAAVLDHARDLGADETILVEQDASVGRTAKLLTDGGVDAAIEFVGSARAVEDAVKAIRPGGRAVVVGVGPDPVRTLPPVLWSNNEYVLMGSYGSLPGDTETMLGLLAGGEIQPPPTVTVGLDEAAELLLRMAAGTASSRGRPVAVP